MSRASKAKGKRKVGSGGARPGAGRKPGEGGPLVGLSVSVRPHVADDLRALARERRETLGDCLGSAVSALRGAGMPKESTSQAVVTHAEID